MDTAHRKADARRCLDDALRLVEEGALDAALERIEKALTLDPGNSEVLRWCDELRTAHGLAREQDQLANDRSRSSSDLVELREPPLETDRPGRRDPQNRRRRHDG